MKKVIIFIISCVGKSNVMALSRLLSAISRKLTYYSHKLNFILHWNIPPQPEWQDQYTTLYYLWNLHNKPDVAERGCLITLGIKPNAAVLELCSGDGFFTKHFHAAKANSIIAVDFDSEAVNYARRYNSATNVSYNVLDIRYSFPNGFFDNIVWNAAIEHFTPSEIDSIMSNIKSQLAEGGVLTGYTVAEIPDVMSLTHHELAFYSKNDLGDLLSKYFSNVRIIESSWPPTVHNFYFYASDGILPFDEHWQFQWTKNNY